MSISSVPSSTGKLVTIGEFLALPNDGRRTELVRGKIVEISPTQWVHGKVCLALASILSKYIDQFDQGHGSVNDSGVVTEEDPDTVRGADAAFCSYCRIPKDALPVGYWPESPEIVFEVLSPSDRPGRTLTKVTEYLDADVIAIIVIDPEDYQVHLNAKNQTPQTLTYQDSPDLKQYLPESLPQWTVPVREFFKYLPAPQ
jgi:Uma2 family endonuclease